MDRSFVARTIDALQAVQLFLAPTRFPGPLPRSIAANEVLRFRNVALLRLVLKSLPLHPFGLELEILAVGSIELQGAAERELDGAHGDAVQQVSVVGDNKEGSAETSEIGFQP